MKTQKAKAYDQLKKLQAVENDRTAFRRVGAKMVEERKVRRSKAAKQREHDAAVMKKSLVAYPKNPRVWEATKVDGGRKTDKRLHPAQARAASKANRKAKKAAAAELRKAEREELRKQKAAAKAEAKAKKLAEREARKVEKAARKAEKRQQEKLPVVQPTQEMYDSVMKALTEQFKLTEKEQAVWLHGLQEFATVKPAQQRNRWRLIETRYTMYRLYMEQAKAKAEGFAYLEGLAERGAESAAVEVPLPEKPVKATNKTVKAVREAVKADSAGKTTAEAFDEPETKKTQTLQQAKAAGKSAEQYADDAIAEAKARAAARRGSNDRKAEFAARLAVQNKVVVSDTPRPAPKATAGVPKVKKTRAALTAAVRSSAKTVKAAKKHSKK